jgi:hypothetical protein
VSAVTVLAGGWSATRVDLRRLPGTVIAVNDSAIYAPRIDIVVSMDRLWTENRFAQVSQFGKPLWLRSSTLRNVRWEGCGHVTPFECDHTSTILSDEPGRLNGTHSGLCAINLAYQMRPSEIYLIGFDVELGPKGERHWFPDYEWKAGGGSKPAKLAEWSEQYAIVAKQMRDAGIDVFHRASITYFRSISSADVELKGA